MKIKSITGNWEYTPKGLEKLKTEVSGTEYFANVNPEKVSLDEYKEAKLMELSEKCQQAIYTGFTATNTHVYSFNGHDQANFNQQLSLLLLDSTITQVEWKTEDAGIVIHTRDEFIAVVKEAEAHKRNEIAKYRNLKVQVTDALDHDTVSPISY